LFFHDFDDVGGRTGRDGGEEHVERSWAGAGVTVDPDLRSPRAAHVESQVLDPVNLDR
jgi:hypothetical protein